MELRLIDKILKEISDDNAMQAIDLFHDNFKSGLFSSEELVGFVGLLISHENTAEKVILELLDDIDLKFNILRTKSFIKWDKFKIDSGDLNVPVKSNTLNSEVNLIDLLLLSISPFDRRDLAADISETFYTSQLSKKPRLKVLEYLLGFTPNHLIEPLIERIVLSSNLGVVKLVFANHKAQLIEHSTKLLKGFLSTNSFKIIHYLTSNGIPCQGSIEINPFDMLTNETSDRSIMFLGLRVLIEMNKTDAVNYIRTKEDAKIYSDLSGLTPFELIEFASVNTAKKALLSF